MDARKLRDERYRGHQGFQDQLRVADYILATKSDLYQHGDLQQIGPFAAKIDCANTPVIAISHGEIDTKLLNVESKNAPQHTKHHHHHHHRQNAAPQDLLEQVKQHGFVSVENQGEGYFSKGWIFSPDIIFDYQSLFTLIHDANVERFKGVAITNQGIFSFNKAEDVLTTQELDESFDSRFEIIHRDDHTWHQLEEQIKSAQLHT